MIIDSSALMAVIDDEPEATTLLRILASTQGQMSVATWLELGIVADSRSAAHGERFGRGSGSRARLNYGDCFAYALSVVSGEPLLYVGEDFTHTDVAGVLQRVGQVRSVRRTM